MQKKIARSVNKLIPILLTGAFAAALLAGFFSKIAWRREIYFDFKNPDIAKSWSLLGNVQSRPSSEGLSIEASQPFIFLSPEFDQAADNSRPVLWEKFPYLKMVLNQSRQEREINFLSNHNRDLNKRYSFPVWVPVMADSVMLDMRSLEVWNHRFPLMGPVLQFGFEFPRSEAGGTEIKSITLASFPSFFDFLKLARASFLNAEIISPYAINRLCGVYFLGKPLIVYLGVFVSFLGILFLIRASRMTQIMLISGMLGSYLLFDFQFDYSLWRHWDDNRLRSAWHASKYEEYRSRYGEEFAKMADVFEQTVPPGAKVFFPREKPSFVRTEKNWIGFLFHPQYPSCEPGEADYIFYYHPAGYAWDDLQKRLRPLIAAGEAVSADVLYRAGDEAMLLKVMHG